MTTERRTTTIPHLRCGCDLCKSAGGELVFHEFVLRESPDRPGSGTATYWRSWCSASTTAGKAALPERLA